MKRFRNGKLFLRGISHMKSRGVWHTSQLMVPLVLMKVQALHITSFPKSFWSQFPEETSYCSLVKGPMYCWLDCVPSSFLSTSSSML